MTAFSFDVEVSDHDSLRLGIIAKRVKNAQFTWHRVVVEADDVVDAHLVAAQMASNQGMCTAVHLRE